MSAPTPTTPTDKTAAAFRSKMTDHVRSKKRGRTANSFIKAPTNPFTYPPNLFPPWELIKFIVGMVTVVPIKIFLIAMTFPPSWVLCLMAISCGFDDKKPMSVARRRLLLPCAWLARWNLFLFGYYWVEVTGKPCSTKEARVLVCAPHSTFIDALYIVYAFDCPSAISKAENMDYPFFGVFFRAIQAITVDRSSREAKDEALKLLKERTSNPNERHLMVFPEGTCTNRTSLISFKRGAFAAGQPVQPIILQHPYCFFDPAWISAGPNRFLLILRLLCQVYNRMRIHFLPVYYPSEEEKNDPELFANNVRTLMADKLGVPMTSHSYHDMFLAKEARKLNVTADALPSDLFELEKLFNVTLGDAKLLLKRYSGAFKTAGGDRIDGETFAKILGIPYSLPVRDLVNTIADEDGKLDFASLLVGVTLMSKALSKVENDEAMELVWASVSHGSEKITRQQMAESLSIITSGGFTSSMVLKVFDKVMSGEHEDSDLVDFAKFSSFLTKSPEVLFVILDGLGGSAMDVTTGGGDSQGDGGGEVVVRVPRLSVLDGEEESKMVT